MGYYICYINHLKYEYKTFHRCPCLFHILLLLITALLSNDYCITCKYNICQWGLQCYPFSRWQKSLIQQAVIQRKTDKIFAKRKKEEHTITLHSKLKISNRELGYCSVSASISCFTSGRSCFIVYTACLYYISMIVYLVN